MHLLLRAEWGLVTLRGSKLEPLMPALGQKQTFGPRNAMSALPPKADIDGCSPDVRFVPKADSCTAAKSVLFDHLVGGRKQRVRNSQAEHFRGLEINR